MDLYLDLILEGLFLLLVINLIFIVLRKLNANKRKSKFTPQEQKMLDDAKAKAAKVKEQKIREDWNDFRNNMIFAKNDYKSEQQIIDFVADSANSESLVYVVGHLFFFKLEEALEKMWFATPQGNELVLNNITYVVNRELQYHQIQYQAKQENKDISSYTNVRQPSKDEDFIAKTLAYIS